MGHYESDGCKWDQGDKPTCDICGKPAKWETAHSGVYLCNRQKCSVEYVRQNCDPIVYVKSKEIPCTKQ